MSNENTGLVKVSVAPPAEIELTAENVDEIEQCQAALVKWARAKAAEVKHQFEELQESWKHAVKRKWKSDVLKRHAAIAEKRLNYYEKIRAAIEAGYQIVPNLPMQIFAIRTDRKKPKAMYLYEETWIDSEPSFPKGQEAKTLPAGDGDYKNPEPTVLVDDQGKVTKPDGRIVHGWSSWADKWQDIEFPISMAKPKIMKAATRAMALKIFDDIGLVEEGAGDPLIVARIALKTGPYVNRRVSFIIAWHLNTREL